MKISANNFESEFKLLQPALRSFLLRMTASVEDTEDLLQDTYIKARLNIDGFRQQSSLKTWVFAIAVNLAKNFLRSKNTWQDHIADLAKEATLASPGVLGGFMQVNQNSPFGAFEIREHISLCFTCIGKTLPIDQQVAVLLKEVYGYSVREIAEICEKTEAMIKHYLHDGRHTMIEIFDKRCALINKEGICHQCSELNGIFNHKHETQKALVKIELAKDAESKSKEELFDLRANIVKSIDPFDGVGCELQLYHLSHIKKVADKAFS